jgi:O-antigen/teichoic acid export membrane protein
MGIVFRQSVKSTLVIFTGAILGALIIYLTSRFIPVQNLGYLRYITSQSVMYSQLMLVGLHITLIVYIHKYPPGDPRRPALVTLSMAIPLVILLFFSIVYFIFRQQIVALYNPKDIYFVTRYFAWLPVNVLLWGYMTILEQYLTSQLKIALATFMKEILLRLVNIVLIVLFAVEYIDFQVFFICSVLANGVPAIALYLLARKTEGFDLSFNYKVFTKAELRDIAHFAWYHSLLTVSMVVMDNLEQPMLPALDVNGMASVAIYANSIFIVTISRMPARAMITATFPILTKAYEEKDHEKVTDLFRRAGLNVLLTGVLMSLLIGLNMPNAVTLFSKEYAAMTPLVLILLIGRLVDMSTGLNNELMSISSLYKYNFRITVVMVLVMIGVNYYLIPRYGVFGAAWGTTISMSCFNILKMLVLWQKMRIQPFSSKSLVVVACGLVAGLCGYLLPYVHDPFTDTIIRSIVICISYLLMLLWLKPSADLNDYLAAVRKNKRLF